MRTSPVNGGRDVGNWSSCALRRIARSEVSFPVEDKPEVVVWMLSRSDR
jgi:hypothetical protein